MVNSWKHLSPQVIFWRRVSHQNKEGEYRWHHAGLYM
jgi:hypothetical protein